MHSRNVVVQCRKGKIKNRGTGNLSVHGPQEHHSTNAGWNWDDQWNFPELEYITSEDFAQDVGVAREAYGDDFEIRKNDWVRKYTPSPCMPLAHVLTTWRTGQLLQANMEPPSGPMDPRGNVIGRWHDHRPETDFRGRIVPPR